MHDVKSHSIVIKGGQAWCDSERVFTWSLFSTFNLLVFYLSGFVRIIDDKVSANWFFESKEAGEDPSFQPKYEERLQFEGWPSFTHYTPPKVCWGYARGLSTLICFKGGLDVLLNKMEKMEVSSKTLLEMLSWIDWWMVTVQSLTIWPRLSMCPRFIGFSGQEERPWSHDPYSHYNWTKCDLKQCNVLP